MVYARRVHNLHGILGRCDHFFQTRDSNKMCESSGCIYRTPCIVSDPPTHSGIQYKGLPGLLFLLASVVYVMYLCIYVRIYVYSTHLSHTRLFNFYLPNSPKFRGAKKGRTGVDGDSSALHFTTGCGQAERSQGGQAGHTVGGGHFTSGQRGRGQAGHSPQSFPQAELSTMIGSGVGMELLRTYWERSGVGGHSVFSM